MEERIIAESFVANNINEIAEILPKEQCSKHRNGEDGVTHWHNGPEDLDCALRIVICIPDNMYSGNWPKDWPQFDYGQFDGCLKNLMIYDFTTGEVTSQPQTTYYENEVANLIKLYPRNIYFLAE